MGTTKMIITVNFRMFQDAFIIMGRSNQFSYAAQRALFDYLEEIEADSGQEMELDVIALCCEFMEIDEDEKEYKQYVGEDADREEFIIATLPCGVLVQQE
jgi:hypothetical protein